MKCHIGRWVVCKCKPVSTLRITLSSLCRTVPTWVLPCRRPTSPCQTERDPTSATRYFPIHGCFPWYRRYLLHCETWVFVPWQYQWRKGCGKKRDSVIFGLGWAPLPCLTSLQSAAPCQRVDVGMCCLDKEDHGMVPATPGNRTLWEWNPGKGCPLWAYCVICVVCDGFLALCCLCPAATTRRL